MDRRTFLAASAGLAAGCGKPAGAPDEPTPTEPVTPPNPPTSKKQRIAIVSSLPRTGSNPGQIESIVNAIKMAIEDSEKDFPFEIIYEDKDDATSTLGEWTAQKEAKNAEDAAKNRDVMAYIGPFNSGAAKISALILNDAGLVQVSPACAWPGLTQKVKRNEGAGEPDVYRKSGQITFCRVCPHDYSQAGHAAEFIAANLKAKSVYILDDKEIYGTGLADEFEAKCKDLKLEVLGHESIEVVQPGYRELMQKIKGLKPDAVFFGGTTISKAPQVAIDMRTVKLDCPLVVPDGCYEEAFIKAAGEDTVNGRCYATIGRTDVSQLKGAGVEFVKRYEEKHKAVPEAYALYGYEAAAVVLAAIKTVGKKDRTAIRKAVLATRDFKKGVLAKWSFDAYGDTTLQQTTISKIEKGKFVPVAVLGGEK